MTRELIAQSPIGDADHSDQGHPQPGDASSQSSSTRITNVFGELYAAIAGRALVFIETLADQRAEVQATRLTQLRALKKSKAIEAQQEIPKPKSARSQSR